MLPGALLFLAGIGLICSVPQVPDAGLLRGLTAVSLLALLVPHCRALALFSLGVAIAGLTAVQYQGNQFPAALTARTLTVEGSVVSLPVVREHSNQFLFQVDSIKGSDWQGLVRLSLVRRGQVPKPGDRLQATVRLKQARGSLNPAGFDYEAWLLMHGFTATGTVRDWRLVGSSIMPLHHIVRGQVRHFIQAQSLPDQVAALLIALAIGEHQQLGEATWRTLSRTGTNHLLIVSGLHIGMVMSALLFMARWLGCGQRTAAMMSLTIAGLYAALAGFGLPVQRALVMGVVLLLALTVRREVAVSSGYGLALLAVLLLAPFAPLGSGLWLSFSAVGVLLLRFANQQDGRSRNHWLRQALLAQWTVCLVTTPLLLWLVGQASATSFLVNLVAIPWVAVTIPVILLAVLLLIVSEDAAVMLLELAAFSLSALWEVLEWAANLSTQFMRNGADGPSLALAGLAAMLWAFPVGRSKWLGLVLLMPLLAGPVRPVLRGWQVTVLDVGQGMSVLIESGGRALLYDAGPSFPGFDAGARIVVPYIRGLGYRFLDALVVSHADNDHAGGVPSVMAAMVVGKHYVESDCEVPRQWAMASLLVILFAAPPEAHQSDNDRSCLLLVSDGAESLLLTGDIEQGAEAALLRAGLLPATVTMMSVPHHGSRTSSSPGLINRVRPEIAMVSSGYASRFGHPHAEVIARYRRRGVTVLETGRHGALIVRVNAGGLTVTTSRASRPAIWRRH